MSAVPPELDIADALPHRRLGSLIWLIPIAAAVAAAYFGYAGWIDRGPLVTIDFDTAEGLIEGQTQVRYKSVPIGTVRAVRLVGPRPQIQVQARLQRDLADRVTRSARFWVVRPRLAEGSLAGLETIVTGAYIEFDPGVATDPVGRNFVGLEEPPGIRTGEPGRMFTLRTRRLGALRPGSTVTFRDVSVGEVVSLAPLTPDGEITLSAFIQAPYDGYIRQGSRFWTTSGITAKFGPDGLKVEVESLRAALGGGIAFDTPAELLDEKEAPADTGFLLYENQEVAISATSPRRLEFLTYLDGSASGIGIGSPVEIRGIRVGSVTSVDLVYDLATRRFVVPVRMALEPGHIAHPDSGPQTDAMTATAELVADGFRVRVRGGNLLTGQKILSIDRVPEAPPASVRMEGGVIVLPAVGGDGDDVMASIGDIAGKLDRFPLDQIGRKLDAALTSINGLVGAPEAKGALTNLSGTLGELQALVRKTDGGLTPVLRRLPDIADSLDQAVQRANVTLGSIERGYGADSTMTRQIGRTMGEVSDASRSVRDLADLLERHPEALIRGRVE